MLSITLPYRRQYVISVVAVLWQCYGDSNEDGAYRAGTIRLVYEQLLHPPHQAYSNLVQSHITSKMSATRCVPVKSPD